MNDDGTPAITRSILREWSAEVRARHALQKAVAAKWNKPMRSLKATIKAHEMAHYWYWAAQWRDTTAP